MDFIHWVQDHDIITKFGWKGRSLELKGTRSLKREDQNFNTGLKSQGISCISERGIGTVQTNLPHKRDTFSMMNGTGGMVTDQVKMQ